MHDERALVWLRLAHRGLVGRKVCRLVCSFGVYLQLSSGALDCVPGKLCQRGHQPARL